MRPLIFDDLAARRPRAHNAAAALGAKERVKVGRRGFFTKAAPIRIDHRASNTLDLRGVDEGGMDPARVVG